MLAYQLIYTACGREKNGSFSVWSKSQSITFEEEEQIIRLMNYRMDPSLPYYPTQEEIDTLFPRQYAYFVLSTGRKCIAQTTYIGDVYSEIDKRTGNFIIHALVFDDFDGASPFSIIDAPVFKTKLTYKEWHDDPVLDDLPQVNVELSPKMNEEAIKKYVINGDSAVMSSFLQSILNSINEDEKTVTFHSTYAEEKELYSLISFLVPKSLHNKLSLANQYSSAIEFSMTGANFQRIKLRNMSNDQYVFNYPGQISSGGYAFDFIDKQFSKIEAGRYVNAVIKMLKTSGVFPTIQFIEKIDSLIKKHNCSPDDATSIINLLNNNFAWFNSANEYIQVLELVEKNGYDTKALCSEIYAQVIKTKKWGFSNDILPLIKKVYAWADVQVKDELIFDYLKSLENFGISKAQEQSNLARSLKENDVFKLSDIKASMLRNLESWKSLITSSQGIVALSFECVADVVTTAGDNKNDYLVYMFKIFKNAIAREDKSLIEKYFNIISGLGTKYENWFIENAVSKSLEAELPSKSNMNFTLYLIMLLSDSAKKEDLIKRLILANVEAPYFMEAYLELQGICKDVISRVEAELSKDEKFQRFFAKKDVIAFRNIDKITKAELEDYFKKYYLTKKDNGAYLYQLKRYLDSISPKEKLQKLFDYYEKFEKLEDSFADVMRIVAFIEKEIYAYELNQLECLNTKQLTTLGAIHRRLVENKIPTSKKLGILHTYLLLKCKVNLDRVTVRIEENRVYADLSEGQRLTFAKEHMNVILESYFLIEKKCKLKDDMKQNIRLHTIIEPIVMLGTNIVDDFIKGLAKLSQDNQAELLLHCLSYKLSNETSELSMKLDSIIKEYLDSLKKSQCKKLFKQAERYIKDDEKLKAVKEYTDDYMSKKPGMFFELFFGGRR